MKTHDKKNILYFYKRSEGELHVALPLIKSIKDNIENVAVFFVFKNKKFYDLISPVNKAIINELGYSIIRKKDFYKYFLKYFSFSTLIVTCDSGLRSLSVLAAKIIKKKKVLFHHHAYALRGLNKIEESYSGGRNVYQRYIIDLLEDDSYYIALSSPHDEDYYKEFGFRKNNLLLAGALGYRKEWIDYIFEKAKKFKGFSELKKIAENKKYRLVIFVPIRRADKNEAFLTEENYKYLRDSLYWLAEKNPDCLFLLKPHPRQREIEDLVDKCNKAIYKNILIVKESTLVLSKISDLTISFWSSAIQDSLSVGTLAIEFHRHQNEHYNLIRDERDELVSLYHYLGFCLSYCNKEKVHDFINNQNTWEKQLNENLYNFNEYFPANNTIVKKFIEKIEDEFSKMEKVHISKVVSFFKIHWYFMKGYIKRKF